jgi:processive 1,2-diacylglycerol beta-glucosyltransferase
MGDEKRTLPAHSRGRAVTFPKSTWFCDLDDGCGYWRMKVPASRVRNATYVHASEDAGSVSLSGADVIVVQRLRQESNYVALKNVRTDGIKIVYDLDDNVWHIPRYNHAYGFKPYWLEKCMSLADLITTTTPYLRRVIEERSIAPVRDVENGVDLESFHVEAEQHEGVRVGWPASPTHHIDGQIAIAELIGVMQAFPQVVAEFSFVMPEQVKEAVRRGWIKPERVSVDQCYIGDYSQWLARKHFDIIIAPLADIPFNRSKSALKLIEAGAVGAAALAGDIEPYRKFCTGKLAMILCKTRKDWREKLSEIVTNEAMRREVRDLLKEHVAAKHTIEKRVERWEEIILEASRVAARPCEPEDVAKLREQGRSMGVISA